MNILYELEEPFRYSWNIVYLLLLIILLLVVIYLLVIFTPFFSKLITKIIKKTSVPNLKSKYLKELEKLKIDVNNKKVDNRDAYMQLSSIIREFAEKTTGINMLSISKEEAKEIKMKDLALLMEEYYPPEFSKNNKGNIITSIDRTMEVIKRWK